IVRVARVSRSYNLGYIAVGADDYEVTISIEFGWWTSILDTLQWTLPSAASQTADTGSDLTPASIAECATCQHPGSRSSWATSADYTASDSTKSTADRGRGIERYLTQSLAYIPVSSIIDRRGIHTEHTSAHCRTKCASTRYRSCLSLKRILSKSTSRRSELAGTVECIDCALAESMFL